MAPSKGAAWDGQIRLLHAAVLASPAEEVAEAQALVFGQNDRESQRLGSSEGAVSVPCRERWVCLFVAGAGAKGRKVPSAVTSIEVVGVRRRLRQWKNHTRDGGS